MLYLNYAALCSPHPDAEQEVQSTLREFQHYLYSDPGIRWYREKSRACREQVAALLHVSDPDSIAFVPNASTANHLVLSSLHWAAGDHIITSTHENPSILRTLEALTHQGVHLHQVIPTSPEKLIHGIQQLITRYKVKAIVLSHVSHIDGRIFPIFEISDMARYHDILCMIDGAQAVGHIPVDLAQWTGDIYFFTGHKWCQGPLGTGALVVHEHFLSLNPTFDRESHEREKPRATAFEIGTHNIGLIAGLAKACVIKQEEELDLAHLSKRQDQARSQLASLSALRIQEWDGPHAPGILTFQFHQSSAHDTFVAACSQLMIVCKVFTDYPKGVPPLVRLSWTKKTSDSDLQLVLTTIRTSLSTI